MKITAMMIVKNENHRYLDFVLPSLMEFCDEVRVVDDNSSDGTHKVVAEHGCIVKRNDQTKFFVHEGRARNELLDFALEGHPTHLLAIDGDEMIEDGQALRQAVETHSSPSGVWTLDMTEVWKADEQHLWERVDGQWGARKVPVLFEVPRRMTSRFRIADRALACGREPVVVAKAGMRSRLPSLCAIYHLGWSCENDREERWLRYVKHDGGNFHAGSHLASIMYPDEQVKLQPLPWPDSLSKAKAGLLARING